MAPTRRAWLATIAASASLAGCLGDGDSDGGDDGSTNGTTDGDSTDGGSNDGDGGTDEGSNGGGDNADSDGASLTVSTAEHEQLGEILVDGDGTTLYMFDPDPQGDGASECTDDCAASWPPLVTEDGVEGDGSVTASLSTFERADGSTQVAANGWPLYYWQGDSEPGDATGQGVNDVWWVLDPEGMPIRSSEGSAEGSGGSSNDDTSGY